MVLSVIILSLIGMMGSMGWIRGLTGLGRFVFSIMNTSMPIILMTIANSDSVHFLKKFFKKLRNTGDKAKAIEQSIDSLMLPIFLTSINHSSSISIAGVCADRIHDRLWRIHCYRYFLGMDYYPPRYCHH
ncbi:MAG: hypothetical protein CM1200mP10_02970 [Candidatus Neomarinimicrobiota bacterium]|nr:MAG: hypothetical protein CM1200mP10_02970 [Candidatus Neomarinimicrobiota bacterium]